MKRINLVLLSLALLSATAPITTLRADDVAIAEQKTYKTYQEGYLANVQQLADAMNEARSYEELPEYMRSEFDDEQATHWREVILNLNKGPMSNKLFDELVRVAKDGEGKSGQGAMKVLLFAASIDRLSSNHIKSIFSLNKTKEGEVGCGAGWALFHAFMHRTPTREQLNKLADLACLTTESGSGADATLHTLAMDDRLSADHFDILMRVATNSETPHWRTSLGVIELVKHGLLDRSHLVPLLEGAKGKGPERGDRGASASNLGLAFAYLSDKVEMRDEDVTDMVSAATSSGNGAQWVLHALSSMAGKKKSNAAFEGLIEVASNDNTYCARPALYLIHLLMKEDMVPEKYMNQIQSLVEKHKDGEKVFFTVTPQHMIKV